MEQQISEESLYNLLKLTFEENIQNYMAPHHALECLFSLLDQLDIEEIGKEYIKAEYEREMKNKLKELNPKEKNKLKYMVI